MKERLYINKPRFLKELEQHDDVAVPLSHTHTQHLLCGGYKGQPEITPHINFL